MTDAEKKMKQYCNAVERRLDMPRAVRDRVMRDFTSGIAARREAGQTDEEIFAELGAPKKAAADLNEQMKDLTYRKSPWRFACLTLAVVSGWRLFVYGILGYIQVRNFRVYADGSSIGMIGGADGPTAIFVTTTTKQDWGNLILTAAFFLACLLGYFLLKRCKRK